jgi:hypothetical protein
LFFLSLAFPIFLDAFEPDSAYLSTLSRPERVEYIRNGFNRMDKHLLELGYELRSLDGDSECSEDCSDLEECSSRNGQPSYVGEEICSSKDLVLSNLATEDSTATCSLFHPNFCNPEDYFSDDDEILDVEYYDDASSERESIADHSSVGDEGVCTNVFVSEFDLVSAWEEESNGGSVYSQRSQGMCSSSSYAGEETF